MKLALSMLVGAVALEGVAVVPTTAQAIPVCKEMVNPCINACTFKKSQDHCERVCDARGKKANRTGIWPMNSGARIPCTKS